METNVVWISFVLIVLSVVGVVLIINRFGSTQHSLDLAGIWQNEALNIRILLHDIDSEFQGSVIWANGMDKLLGFKVVKHLKFNGSKKGKGTYSDPLTGQQFEINLTMKRKGLIQINAYHPHSENLVFSQEWKKFVS